MQTCGSRYGVYNPETRKWVWYDDYREADRVEAEILFGKAAQAIKDGRQVILLGSQIRRMEQAGMMRDGRVVSTPAPKVSE